MQEKHVISVNKAFAEKAYVNREQYQAFYQESISSPDIFWKREAQRLDWIKPFTKIKNTNFSGNVSIKWFEDGALNVCVNCVDRHLPKRATQTAIIWESDNGNASQHITYQELYHQVVRLSNALKHQGVQKGDRVIIYLPMIPEAAYAMLACARIGAVHSVVFGGFSPESLKGRIEDCAASVIITANEGLRGGKIVALKANVDAAIENLPVKTVLVVKHTDTIPTWKTGRDIWYHEAVAKESDRKCIAETMNAEDPLFILYTSGSTGKPKGVLHTTSGYLLWAAMTHHYVFDYHEGDVYWCTADIGWVTGHTYVIYGPLANGAVTVMYEGVPNYPDWSRSWQIIDKHKVNIYYTAPTAIRSQLREGNEYVTRTSRKTLRLLGTVGEPINPDVWEWYYEVVGEKRCPVVDTWWQTETGGHLITPLPGATDLKPGSATLPFFGIKPEIVDEQGNVLEGEAEGRLCISDSWPGQMRTVYGDHQRFIHTYFSQYPGKYFTGDGAKRDQDGYYWITGRVDDVLNVSGHRLGTAEVESALVSHELVAEAAVVGYPHNIKGQGIYCYVTLNAGVQGDEGLRKELIEQVRKIIGPIATPDVIQWAPSLPKTRSGKIMRRILRKIAEHKEEDLGDTNTLLNPDVVKELISGRPINE